MKSILGNIISSTPRYATPLSYIYSFLIISDIPQQLVPVGFILSDAKKSDQWNPYIHI